MRIPRCLIAVALVAMVAPTMAAPCTPGQQADLAKLGYEQADIQKMCGNASALFEKAYIARESGDLKTAQQLFEQGLRIEPGNALGQKLLAEVKESLSSAQKLFEQAYNAKESGDLRTAQQLFERGLKIEPANALGQKFLAEVKESAARGGTTPQDATAQVRWFRYSLGTFSGDPTYVGEIAGGPPRRGANIEVETSVAGVPVRVARVRDGKKVSETVYRYAANPGLADGFDSYTEGEMRGRSTILRNAQGDIVRVETYTLQGDLTNYSTRAYYGSSGEVEVITYAADGKRTYRLVYVYSSARTMIRSRGYPDDSIMYETEIIESTGQAKSRHKYINGNVTGSETFAYDADGEHTRDDFFDAKGMWFGAREYAQGLKVVERYKFSSGETAESRTTYDDRRWAKETKLYRNGNLVCTFSYDRMPNGAVKRTLAIGPGGDLYAEYPNLYVDKVQRNGQPIDRTSGIIHRNGNWW